MKVARLLCSTLALMLITGLATWSHACDKEKATATASAKDARGASKGMKISAAAVSPAADQSEMIYLAGANGSCGTKTRNTSASAAGQCTGHGMASMAALGGHQDCDACTDMADCSGELDAAGAHRQTVRLKNGIMYVYTAASARNVSAVQAAVTRRVDRMSRFASAGDKARLCPECKSMRGAMASGKLNREVVNIEGGTLTLVTSSDPSLVAKLHAMAGDTKMAARIKS